MKILIALHQPDQTMLFSDCAEMNGHNVIKPKVGSNSLDDVVVLLEDKPDRVLMDVNYGKPGSQDVTPIQRVADSMRQRGYDIQKALLGVTGNDYLADDVRDQYQIPATPKTSFQDVFKFLS